MREREDPALKPAWLNDVVGVTEGQDVAAREAGSNVASRSSTLGRRRVHHANARMVASPSLNDFCGSVGGTIVGDDDLPWIIALLAEKGLQLFVQPREAVLDGNDDADHGLNLSCSAELGRGRSSPALCPSHRHRPSQRTLQSPSGSPL